MLKKVNSGQLEVAIDENPTYTTREVSKTFNVSRHMTIYRVMKKLGLESLKGWQIDPTWEMGFVRNQQATMCDLLSFTAFSWTSGTFFRPNHNGQHEKWILYNNFKRKRQPIPQPRSGLYPILLCVWWDLRGIVYCELIDDNQITTFGVYCR
ncbi:unnamed protein product [Hymenolepis diminuta]|uniref:HTH_48 domain-containing protein n=1 Tax=Hymenolepis diminuta TaxID=6216 RepID=A0A564Y9H6_HYMDI|nr:unnamed protein product [Hymenolepis diminuta]